MTKVLGVHAMASVKFQSTPPAEARGDGRLCIGNGRSTRGFNPLPPPKRGETPGMRWRRPGYQLVSIHSPRRSEGRPASSAARPPKRNGKLVSIHSPRRSEGRRPLATSRRVLGHTPVSIHSPRRSEGRRRVTSSASNCFNPLPPPKRGETASIDVFQSTPPAEARGDFRAPNGSPKTFQEFQSTPPAEARGDGAGTIASRPCRLQSFNPLPPPKRGETLAISARSDPIASEFQSTPPAEARGDLLRLAGVNRAAKR